MNKYQFLWGRKREDKEEKHFTKTIKAKSLDAACEKFYKNLPSSIGWLDYEVKEGEVFHNIFLNEKLSYLI